MKVALVLLALAGIAFAETVVGPEWYSCDPTTCKPPNCTCPSDSSPGGLTTAETPQFVLIQHSNALEEVAYGIIEGVRKDLKNSNGCPIPMTWFAMSYHSNCSSAWDAVARGDEVAMQTNRYTPIYPFNIPRDPNPRYDNHGNLTMEIEMSRDWWNSACKLKFNDMVGFRSPELVHNPPVREALYKLGFLYDATITEYYASYNPTSPSKSEILWPYTMNDGIPQDCNFTAPSGFCDNANANGEKYPGMWEVPLYMMQSTNGSFLAAAEYGDDEDWGDNDIYTVLKQNFDDHYNGNRAPITISIDVKWLNKTSNAKALRKFIEYTLTKSDTFYSTTIDLVHWMQNPTPLKEIGDYLTCPPTSEPGARNTPTGLAATDSRNIVFVPAPAPAEEIVETPTPAEEIVETPAPAEEVASPAAAPSAVEAGPIMLSPPPEVDVATQSTSGAIAGAAAGAATLAAALLAALALLA